ncbi:MAG: preprotein translocase subunit SecG, partial [Bradymonadia bacterium]
MTTAITILFVLNCFFLILVVLLQAGKGGGLTLGGGGGGGGASGTVFGATGGATFLQKLTVASAAAFMVLSMTLAHLSSTHSGVAEGTFVDPDAESVLEAGGTATGEAAPEAAPATEATSPEA